MTSQLADPRLGTVLGGRYRILARIASGGMGVVYKAERLQLGRAVAVKFLHSSFVADKEFTRRFEVEARAMSRLAHPHCVSVIDYGVDDAPYMVMEFVTGKTLRALLDEGPLSPSRALQIAKQLLAGLAHAHKQGIVHRDVKPANIMLTEATGTGDHVRILDFGLAKLRDGTGDQSAASIAVGTPSYMSPEQVRGRAVDARSDVYSAGILCFELLTGRKPFESDQAYELLAMHADHAPPTLASVVPEAEFSPELEAVLRRAMAKSPDDRYQSAGELADALDATPEGSARYRPGTDEPPGGRARGMTAAGAVRSASDGSTSMVSGAREPSATRAFPPMQGSPLRRWLAVGGTLLALLAASGAAAYLASKRNEAERGDVVATSRPPGAGAERDPAVAPPVAATPDAGSPAPSPDAGDPPEPTEELPPEERAEPVAALAEEETVDDRAIDTRARPSIAETTRTVDSVDDAERLIRDGETEAALAGLLKLRKKSPRSAYVAYLIGNLYFEKRYWSAGMDAYQDAIRNNGAYRRRAILNRNVIRALASGKTQADASSLLRRTIGTPALTYLRKAARDDKNPTVRARAAALVKKMTEPDRTPSSPKRAPPPRSRF